MDTVIDIDGQQVNIALQDLSIQDQSKVGCAMKVREMAVCEDEYHHGVCAICLNKIVLRETALVKGCEHAYCVICILRWATYKTEPTCPQCKHPFEFLNVHRSLDGSIHDYMFEESVCLLLRASWFNPLIVENHEELDDEVEDFYLYGDEEEDLDDVYLGSSSNLRIGNRRWGDNGYVRGGRQEARLVNHCPNNIQDSGAGPSRVPKKKRGREIHSSGSGAAGKKEH